MGASGMMCDAMEALEQIGGGAIINGVCSWDGIPHSTRTVDPKLSLPDISRRVMDLCKELFKGWSELDDCCFTVERVSGGITNLLLKVSVKDVSGDESRVTVRLYGPNTDYVIDRERELQATKHLSAAGFGAKLLGVFGNGMVQSFITARTLKPADLRVPNLAAAIANQLRRFHAVEIPGSKEPQLWNDIFKLYENASILQFADAEKQRIYETISMKDFYGEIIEIKELTALVNSPVVFAHNDLVFGNLMFNDEEEKLYMIDFEYGAYGYRGFDIANHFIEYAGYDCDYNLYPNLEEQYHFFRHYLQPGNPHEVPVEELEALYVESTTFMLVSHIFWALWALIQAKMSRIDFDYLGYFSVRYEEYKRQKETCCSLARSYVSGMPRSLSF
ncbi:unnamed protein product [Linum tenue]|uniref:ethanolamine kinase n=1 Tax=Linum tenue TaxID=586396 RepID=A0AAV0JM26_9ROSI|nr:unnamed protein product [Linum tenue]